MVAGHSKGANLAVYAASQIQPELQEKYLQFILTMPLAWQAHLTETTGYQDVIPKFVSYVPQWIYITWC